MTQVIGIANLPNQRHRLVSKKGVDFCILVLGEAGLGKSTFINALFATSLVQPRSYHDRFTGESGVSITVSKAGDFVIKKRINRTSV
jgi:cell division control protein 12